MARATVETRVTEVTRVTLELSGEEASALRAVLGAVGGSPESSRRGLCGSVFDALEDAGIDRGPRDSSGSIYFQRQR